MHAIRNPSVWSPTISWTDKRLPTLNERFESFWNHASAISWENCIPCEGTNYISNIKKESQTWYAILYFQSRDLLPDNSLPVSTWWANKTKMAAKSNTWVSDAPLSKYFYTLEANVQSRYRERISMCDGVDPYCLRKSEFSTDFKDLPCVQFPDISNYLVIQT